MFDLKKMAIFNRYVCRTMVLVLFAGTGIPVLRAATPNRIAAPVESGGTRVAINDSVPARARTATDAGTLAGTEALTGVTLHFNMSDAQQADLKQLLANQQNPSSALYHQWLTPTQFGARFGMSSGDLTKVKAWLQSQGLTVTAVAPSSNNVSVSGTVAQIDAAFGTSIHAMTGADGVSHISNLTDPSLPAAMASVVTGITGLNDFKPMSRAKVSHVRDTTVSAKYTSSISGSHYIAPGDFYTIYDVTPLLQNSITGTGMSIAIAGQTDISTTDVAAFRTASGLAANLPTIIQATGYTAGTTKADIDEAQLDVEWSGAVAPAATIKYVTVGASKTASVMDAVVYAITNNSAPIISTSYGACESSWGQSSLNAYDAYFQQANAQGITIVGPSGDSGATDCDYNVTTAKQGLAVDYPASSAYATGVGGTMFNEGSGSYWGTTNGSYSGSATSYIPETVWNETSVAGELSAGGGGASKYFAKPTWQIGTGVPSDQVRDVPDISLNAAASHDGYLFCSQGSCTNGYRDASNNLNVVGGTSVSTPSFAGILALLEQTVGTTTGTATGGLGNVNPMIYGLANSTYYGTVFHDITSGNNDSPCTTGSTNCPSGGSIGFTAGTGYDQATGWGSIDAYNFVTKWSLVSPVGVSTTTPAPTGSFQLTAGSSTATMTTTGSTSVTLTITPNGYTGKVILSALSSQTLSSTLLSFSPTTPITITSNDPVTVNLTIAASQASALLLHSPHSQTVVAKTEHTPDSHRWYGAGSGVVLACSLLFVCPRRRRWGALFAVVLSVAAFTTSGCGGSSASTSTTSTSTSTTTTSTSTTTTTAGPAVGTYNITVTATSTGVAPAVTQSVPITLTVTN